MMKLSQFKKQKIIDHHYEIELLELVDKMNVGVRLGYCVYNITI